MEFSFLFDIYPSDNNVELTIRLAVFLHEKGHRIYYTDSSDSSFTLYLLRKGIGRVLYPGDFDWFKPDLVLLDRQLEERTTFYQAKQIQVMFVALKFSYKRGKRTTLPMLFLTPSPLDYQEQSNEYLVCAGPLLDMESQKCSKLSVRQQLFINRRKGMANNERKDRKQTIFVVIKSLGSQEADCRFYDSVKSFCMQDTDKEVVVCSNRKELVNELFPLPVNMQFYTDENLRKMIISGDVLLSSGNLDLLIHCIYEGVAMLLLPVTEEQNENVNRLIYHGLGVRLPDNSRSKTYFSEQVQALLQQKKDLSEKMARMRERFEQKNNQLIYVVNWLEKWAEKGKTEV